MAKPKISGTKLLNDIRSGLSDEALKEKYHLSERGLHYLLTRLAEAGLITEIEFYERTSLSETGLNGPTKTIGPSVLTCHVCGSEIPDGSATCPYCEVLEKNLSGTLILDPADTDPDAVNGTGDISLDSELLSDSRTLVPLSCQDYGMQERSVACGAQSATAAESHDTTALLRAASRGNREVVADLLDKGVLVDARSKYLNTALMRAAFREHLDVAELLLNRGADVNAQNSRGNSALILAAGQSDPAMTALLLAYGANPGAKTLGGNTALIIAAHHGTSSVVQTLLNYRADVDESNDDGDTSLMKACEKGHAEAVGLLIQYGAHVNKANSFGNTALMKAAYKGHHLAVKLLLKAGADPNAKNTYGNTALMKAAFKGRELVVRRLLEADADANAEDNVGNTALMRAQNGRHLGIVDLLSHFVAPGVLSSSDPVKGV
jgi:ankyrin repeat protein